MICTPKKFTSTIVALLGITLAFCSGYDSDVIASEPKTDGVIISGDLGSVDWKSMVGKEVTIKGDLVVVDTYNLARHGQVKVARDRLYIPTSQVDPLSLIHI